MFTAVDSNALRHKFCDLLQSNFIALINRQSLLYFSKFLISASHSHDLVNAVDKDMNNTSLNRFIINITLKQSRFILLINEFFEYDNHTTLITHTLHFTQNQSATRIQSHLLFNHSRFLKAFFLREKDILEVRVEL